MRFGINLWGVWKHLARDPQLFCKTVRKCGYRYLEPCIVIGDGIDGLPRFMEEAELAKLLEIAGKEGLQTVSAHAIITDEERAAERMKSFAKSCGIRQFVLKCPDTYTEDAYESYAQKLMKYADALKEVGAEILLHNEGAEIAAQLGGVSAYEWLLRRCGGKVFAEPDVGWMMHGSENGKGGADPEEFLWKNAEYVHAIHYKDFAKGEDGVCRQCAIGEGMVDLEAVFQFARAAEVIQYADQDESEDMMRDLQVTAKKLSALQHMRPHTRSILSILDTQTGEVSRIRTFDRVIEAPNWLKDDDTLIYNSDGHLFRYSLSKDTEQMIDTGSCDNCNNDHVLSPDHKKIALSHWDEKGTSNIYIVPVEGGEPYQVTEKGHSFLHGWSPDGRELSFCGFRQSEETGETSVDIICVPALGGKERRLTKDAGFNDGPEYAPDGRKIWFISTRSGLMQVWRMDIDGQNQEQMTFEEQNNWFGHVSPDGKKVINLAYSKDGLDPEQHLPNMNVSLWLMDSDGNNRKKVLDFFGGQGSINVNSWAQDSRRVAFVEYELLHK